MLEKFQFLSQILKICKLLSKFVIKDRRKLRVTLRILLKIIITPKFISEFLQKFGHGFQSGHCKTHTSLGLKPFSGNIVETIFNLFPSILHYFREYLLKIGDNSGMKRRLGHTCHNTFSAFAKYEPFVH